MPSMLFDPTIKGLAEVLTLREKHHAVLASNVANVETPGYRARDLDFEEALEAAFAGWEHADRQGPTPAVVEDRSVPPRADGNSVDLDIQMAKLSFNASRFTTVTRLLGHRLNLLRQAIEGTR